MKAKWLAAYALGYAAVAVLGLLAKLVIEGTTDTRYELHWFTTMPVLAALFAYVGLRYRRGAST